MTLNPQTPRLARGLGHAALLFAACYHSVPAQAEAVLENLEDDFDILDGTMVGPTEVPLTPDTARRLVEGVQAVDLDLGAASAAELASYKALADASLALGIPLILEDIADPDAMAEVTGIGIVADAAMITRLGPSRYKVRVYGEDGALEFGDDTERETEEVEAEAPGVVVDPPVVVDEPVVDLGASVLESDPIAAAVEEISATLRGRSAAPSVLVDDIPGYRYYLFQLDSSTVAPGGFAQHASLDMSFEAELVRDSARGQKYVFFRPVGPGQHPGTLLSNSESMRGYYQEFQEFSFAPEGSASSNLSIYEHAPKNANNATTYTSSTGWSVSAGVTPDGPEVGIGFSSSEQVTTTLSDFSARNNTSGKTGAWRFHMTQNWADMYEYPVLKLCRVKSLPSLAVNNLDPKFELIYNAAEAYSGNATFELFKKTQFRRIWRGGTIFVCEKNSHSHWFSRTRHVVIGFGAV